MPLRPRPVPTAEQIEQIDRHDWYRASGDCVCSTCNKLYYDHLCFAEPFEWLNVICNGDIVKL